MHEVVCRSITLRLAIILKFAVRRALNRAENAPQCSKFELEAVETVLLNESGTLSQTICCGRHT